MREMECTRKRKRGRSVPPGGPKVLSVCLTKSHSRRTASVISPVEAAPASIEAPAPSRIVVFSGILRCLMEFELIGTARRQERHIVEANQQTKVWRYPRFRGHLTKPDNGLGGVHRWERDDVDSATSSSKQCEMSV